MISFHELTRAVQEAGALIVLAVLAHGIITAAGRVFAAVAYGIARNKQ